ncbi:hypothetical protein [Selenomonas ruminantium]|uniref:hypothetical protein n=1 Tax=Selenomonas ruminantium TaxID=971 RepID=UPI0026F05594|nr:hypothetical protein [Selenomonas ruminantium]
MKQLEVGARVRWNTANGPKTGEIVRIEYVVKVDGRPGIIRADAGSLEELPEGPGTGAGAGQ